MAKLKAKRRNPASSSRKAEVPRSYGMPLNRPWTNKEEKRYGQTKSQKA